MLPSTGLFKTIKCPYFDANGSTCIRPYCHFKHAKRDDETKKTSTESSALDAPQILELPPIYKPTPINRQSSSVTIQKCDEYQPTICNAIQSNSDPIYQIDNDKCDADISIEKGIGKENTTENGRNNIDETDIEKNNENDIVKDHEQDNVEKEFNLDELIPNSQDGLTELSDLIDNEIDSNDNTHKNGLKDNNNRSSSEQTRHKSSSTSSSKHRSSTDCKTSSHRDKSKSSSSSSSSSRKDHPKDGKNSHSNTKSDRSSRETSQKSSSNKLKDSKDTNGSSSKSKNHSSSSHNRDKDKDRDKNRNSHRSSSSTKNGNKDHHTERDSKSRSNSSNKHKSDKNHQSSSSSSSSSSKNKDKSAIKNDKFKNAEKSIQELIKKERNDIIVPSPSSVFDSESDDDVEKQCRQIFDEYQIPDQSNAIEIDKPVLKRSHSDEPTDKYDDSIKKKRVAYTKAQETRSISITPKAPATAKHNLNAMQAIYKRQEIIRKQIEDHEKLKEQKEQEEAAANREKQLKSNNPFSIAALKPRPPSTNSSSSSLSTSSVAATTDTATKLTPLISPLIRAAAVARQASRSIAPVSNMIALQRAKEKINQLKASKQPTLAQTISKTSLGPKTRVAHATMPVKETRPAPPILEPAATKISYNIRMQYYNMMVKHCLDIYDSCEDAWERAQTEELNVFKKCNTPMIYKSSALLAVNKLRKESLEAGNTNTQKNNVVSHEVILAGKQAQNTSWCVNKKLKSDSGGSSVGNIDTCRTEKAYEMIYDIRLTEEQLKTNGYPFAGARPGQASVHKSARATPANGDDRYCRRCGKIFRLDHFDEDAVDACNYHPKSPGYRRGFADNAHRCCQLPAGSPGCMYANHHVTDYVDYTNLSGFIKTISRGEDYVGTRNDIYALDCEMCYTTVGLELTRITIIDMNTKVVYDSLVKPDNRIVDYNTAYSGITEEMMENETRTLRDIQAVLLTMFHSKTILVGHSLESDLMALKLIHDVIVDTSILYPHKMGPPKKRALKTLCIENLKRIIQEDEGGHDSAEDAEVCIQLVKHFLRNRIT